MRRRRIQKLSGRFRGQAPAHRVLWKGASCGHPVISMSDAGAKRLIRDKAGMVVYALNMVGYKLPTEFGVRPRLGESMELLTI